MEFEPTPDGTTIHLRFGPPKTKREQTLLADLGPEYEGAIRSVIPDLLAQLEERAAAYIDFEA